MVDILKMIECWLILCLFLIFSASTQTVSFYNQDESGGIQRVTFDSEQVKKIFHGSFHKVRSLDFLSAGLTFGWSSSWIDGNLLWSSIKAVGIFSTCQVITTR